MNKNKRKNIESGAIFGIFMAIFYFVQNLLTADHLTQKEVLASIISGLIGGTIAGFLFGWTTGLIAKAMAKGINLVPDEDETILFETGANHFKGIEAVGGKLYLTTKRLIFKSHRFNFQKHTLSINLDEIASVGRYKVWGISNNGLLVKTKSGLTAKFTVVQPEEWLQHLDNKNVAFL
jgi:hypothetical protein